MKKCPYCNEDIQDEAIKCRYCGEFFDEQKENINVNNPVEKKSSIYFDNLNAPVKDGNPTKNKWTVGGVIGALVGLAFGRYAGIYFLIPFGGALLCGWIASKVIKQTSKPMMPAFAVQGGHAIWMFIGLISLNQPGPTLGVVLMAAGLIWLITNPCLAAVICLTIYQAIYSFANLSSFLTFPFGSDGNKALLVHIIFRVLGIMLMFYGLYEIRKKNPVIKRG